MRAATTPHTGIPVTHRSLAELEAARLRYELSRLRDRRTVRAALALTSWRRDGLGAVWASVRGQPPRWDAAGPDDVPARPRYPHLRVAHLAPDPVSAGVAPSQRLTPGDVRAIRRDRVDLLLVDDVWDGAALAAAVRAARDVGAAVVAVGGRATACLDAAGLAPTLVVALTDDEVTPAPRAHLRWLPSVDPRVDAPVGRSAHPVGADGADLGALLRRIARAEVPVVADDAALRPALGPLTDEVVAGHGQVATLVTALGADPDACDALSVRLRRHVLAHHSRAARMDELVAALGLDERPRRRIGLLLATRRPGQLPRVTGDLARQSHDDLELVVAVHGDEPVPPGLHLAPSHVLHVAQERPLGAVLNAALDATTSPLLAKIDDDDRYGRHHLEDLLLALDYSGAEMVGKRRHALHDLRTGALVVETGQHEERWEDHLPGATLLVRGEVLRALRWRHVPSGVDTELVRAIHLTGGACYSTHRFGFVRTRHGDNTFAGDASLRHGARATAGLEAHLAV